MDSDERRMTDIVNEIEQVNFENSIVINRENLRESPMVNVTGSDVSMF